MSDCALEYPLQLFVPDNQHFEAQLRGSANTLNAANKHVSMRMAKRNAKYITSSFVRCRQFSSHFPYTCSMPHQSGSAQTFLAFPQLRSISRHPAICRCGKALGCRGWGIATQCCPTRTVNLGESRSPPTPPFLPSFPPT